MNSSNAPGAQVALPRAPPSAMHQAFLRSPFMFTLGLVLVLAALGVGAYFLATDVLLGDKGGDASGGGRTPGSTTPPATSPPATSPPATTPPATSPPATTPPVTTPPATTPPVTSPPSTTPPPATDSPTGTDSPVPSPPGGGGFVGTVTDAAKGFWEESSVAAKIGVVAASIIAFLVLLFFVVVALTGFGRGVLRIFTGGRGAGSDRGAEGASDVVVQETLQALGTPDMGRKFRQWEKAGAEGRAKLLRKAREEKTMVLEAIEDGRERFREAMSSGQQDVGRTLSSAIQMNEVALKNIEKEVAVLEAFARGGGTFKRMKAAVKKGEEAYGGGALSPESIARMNASMRG